MADCGVGFVKADVKSVTITGGVEYVDMPGDGAEPAAVDGAEEPEPFDPMTGPMV